MGSAKLNDWMQIVGIFAVVASLIFVGLQMQQTQEIAKATLYQMRSDSARELSTVLIENQQVRTVFLNARVGGTQGMTADDKILLESTVNSVLGHFENSHHLYQLGFLSQEQWDADRRQIQEMVGPYLVRIWSGDRSNYRESFAREIDAILASSD